MLKARLVAVAFLAMTGGPALFAAEPAGSPEFFEKKVRPVLVEHCFKCHSDMKGKEPKGGLRLDSRTAQSFAEDLMGALKSSTQPDAATGNGKKRHSSQSSEDSIVQAHLAE